MGQTTPQRLEGEGNFVVRYVCRHCHRQIGQYDGSWADPLLGLQDLSAIEQQELLEVRPPDHTVWVKILCERCLPVPWMDELWYN